MSGFSQKWTIAALLEDVAEGTEFHYTDLPLHVTLAGVFEIDFDGRWLANGLASLLVEQKAFSITADDKEMFGPNNDVAVMKIIKTKELIGLHNKINNWLLKADAVYNEPKYQGINYNPHSTFQKSGSLKEGEARQINSLSIIDLFPDGNGYQRKVFKTIELG